MQPSGSAPIALVFASILCLAGVVAPAPGNPAPRSPARAQEPGGVLQAYVARPDASYGWQVRQRTRLGQADCIELTLTSQTWKGLPWQHRLFLIVPDGVEAEADALLVVEGGRWEDEDARPLAPDDPPAYPREATLLAGFARQLGAPVAVLLNVPRQPIFEGRSEDEIIAYTFDRFLETGDTDWPLLLPMVKSAVRAMDAVQAFAAEDRSLRIRRFTVTGASKRGWTTWLTAAADDRVAALAPMVIDMLNLREQLPHQFDAWGQYSPRIHDYTEIDLAGRIDTPRGRSLLAIVDPYSYRGALAQPKLLLLGTNDPFWTLDALNLYWDGLAGPKAIVYVPNAGHDLAMDWRRVFGGVRALHLGASGGPALPGLTWAYEPTPAGVSLRVEPGEAESQVRLWSATAPTRDFREAVWFSQPLTADAAGRFTAEVARPDAGYRAAYAEATYPRGDLPLSLSTTIRIIGPADEGSAGR